jgi:uncharacterized membrane protein YgcG
VFSKNLNKRLHFIFLFCAVLFFQDGIAQGFVVDNAKVDIYISEEGYFDVVEKYDLTFTERKHGIYRNIQIKYNLITSEGERETRRIKIRKVEVLRYKYEDEPDFVQDFSDYFEIKIGDKDKTLIGPHRYEIKYRVYNAFLFEDSQVQFYWNIKPDQWRTNFRNLEFSIHPPENASLNLDDFSVYSGVSGHTELSKEFEIDYSDGIYNVKSRPGFNSGYGQSVTALLKMPRGSVKEIKPFWPFWSDYGWTLVLAIILGLFYWIWRKFGKDDSVVAAISYFPPIGVDSAMAGFLIDDRADTPDLISLIPSWGSRGIIKMEQIPKSGFFGKEDTKITRLQPLPADSPDYEEEIFTGLFGNDSEGEKEILVSSLENTFYTTMSSAKEKLRTKAEIYYDPKARKIKKQTTIGILLVNVALFFLFLFTWGLLAALAIIPVTIFLLIMTFYLVKKNSKGNEVLSELQGFKQFIKVAEENKLKMLLHDSPNYFETTMAFAVAFGLFDKWAKKFEALDLQPPTWYTSSAGVMSMNNFSNSFSSSLASTQSTMVSAPSSSSSGGGSSGGGFGGGGGGSW